MHAQMTPRSKQDGQPQAVASLMRSRYQQPDITALSPCEVTFAMSAVSPPFHTSTTAFVPSVLTGSAALLYTSCQTITCALTIVSPSDDLLRSSDLYQLTTHYSAVQTHVLAEFLPRDPHHLMLKVRLQLV